MKMKITAVLLTAVMLSGCAGTVTDQYSQSHPKGVAYYDQVGQYHPAEPEAVSPKSQDAWETVGWVALGALAIAGAATGIVSLTK